MRNFCLLVFALFIGFLPATASSDWGKKGHRTTGEIAQKYLSKKAERKINALLNGQTLAFVSNYGDDIKSDSAYRSYGPWHYVNYPFGGSYETHPKSEKGDLIAGIHTCIEVLKNEKASEEEKVFHLKMLVHFVGDLHQPLHVGIAEDKGGNDFQVRWFNDGTNLHTVWDTKMIEDYGMSYTELAENADQLSSYQLEAIEKGTVIDWMNESRALCEKIYATTEVGEKLGYRYMYDYTTTFRSQLQKGGIRLAVLLNDIFG